MARAGANPRTWKEEKKEHPEMGKTGENKAELHIEVAGLWLKYRRMHYAMSPFETI